MPFRLIFAMVATLAATWAHAAELTPARREAIRQLGEAEAFIALCGRYEYHTLNLVEFYIEARLPPSLVSSDEDFQRLYVEAQDEMRLLVDELSTMASSDPKYLSCVFADQVYRSSGNDRPILTLTKAAIEADKIAAAEKAARAERFQAEALRARAEPFARVLKLMRLCTERSMVINERIFRQHVGNDSDTVRTEAVRMVNDNQVDRIPPIDEACAVAEAEYGPSGIVVKDLLIIGK